MAFLTLDNKLFDQFWNFDRDPTHSLAPLKLKTLDFNSYFAF
jgi:hypothetical protein